MTKQGNSFIRWLMVEDAWVAVAAESYYGNLYDRHKVRIGKARAILPVARALLYAVYKVWMEQKSYDEIFKVVNPHHQYIGVGVNVVR